MVLLVLSFSGKCTDPAQAASNETLNRAGRTVDPASASFTDKPAADEIHVAELEFKDSLIKDAVRIISELTGVNIVATQAAGKAPVTLFVRDLSVTDIVDSLCRVAGLWYRHNPTTDIFIVMTTEEYQKDIVVFRDEHTRSFQLEYLNVGIAARTIADLFGDRVELLGKANRHYGSDYEVGKSYEYFKDDYDKAEMDEDENDDDDDEDDDNTTYKKTRKTSKIEFSADQLALLERMRSTGTQVIAESEMRKVTQHSQAKIYVTVNRLHNMLFVRSSDVKAMEDIAEIITESDKQVPEVLLEMKVLEVQLTDQFQSAFDIANISGSEQSGPDDGHNVNPLNAEAGSVGSSLLGMGNFDVMTDSTMVFQVLSGNLRMRLQLLEQEGNIASISTPMLLAANNHPAKLFIGEEAVLTTGFTTEEIEITTSGSSDVTINTMMVPETETRSIGDTLTILPSINADRSVVMRIVHENSTVVTSGGRIPVLVNDDVDYVAIDTVNTSSLEGTVLAQDGMTVAIGGMVRKSKSTTESKVPVLGDIPLLGFFFSETEDVDTRTELILLITPHILSAPEQAEQLTRNRMADLTSHPNHIDSYFEELDRNRAAMKQADAATPSPARSEITATGLEQSFIEMTRVAAKQVRMPYLSRTVQGKVQPVNLRELGSVPLFRDANLAAVPSAAWTDGLHFLTAVKVVNLTDHAKPVDVNLMRGEWMAATVERQQLAPAGEEGDFTYLYLISETSFETKLYGERR